MILGGNPAYTAPADLQFGAALAKVANSIHLGVDDDETAAAAKWHLPEAHYLESWGDARSTDGVVAIQQPMIEPIFGGKSAIEVMAVLLDSKDRKGYDMVKNYWTVAVAGCNVSENDLEESAERRRASPARKPAEVKPTVDAQENCSGVAAEPKPRRAESKSASFPAPRRGTDDSPTTPGCRKRPIRSPSWCGATSR